MKSRKSPFLPLSFATLFTILTGMILIGLCACSDPSEGKKSKPKGGAAAQESQSSEKTGTLADQPIEEHTRRLLEYGINMATAYPKSPYIKTRSREQERVVMACLELDQPATALKYADKIDNWRKGVCYAEFAFYCAQRQGDVPLVKHYLDLADKIAEEYREDPDTQAWRVDRIRIGIAKTYFLLGKHGEAATYEADAEDNALGDLLTLKAQKIDEASFEEQIDGVDHVVLTGSLDAVSNSLAACVELFDRFYEDPERRAKAEEKITSSLRKIPMMKAIDFMAQLAGLASKHGDQDKALALLEEARRIMDEAKWLMNHKVPMLAKLALVRYRVGHEAKAREEADAALALFEAERELVTDMFRPEALLPLAETYHAMGDREAALKVYKRALAEGVLNAGPRVQAEDLVQACCSMALNGFEPDEEIWSHIEETYNRLIHNSW